MRNLSEIRAKKMKGRNTFVKTKLEEIKLTDEEIEQCKKEDGYYDFIKPLAKLTLERAFEEEPTK